MTIYTMNEIAKILNAYDPDHDLGPQAPVTWREHRLAEAIEDLQEQISQLETKVSSLLDAVPSASR